MAFILKRNPVWMESFLVDNASEPFAQLVGDGGCVSVPANLLVAFSPLLRGMMTDLIHPVYSPLVILLPGVSGDVLQVVKELLIKGTSVMNEDMKMMVQQVFKMISIGATFTCCVLDVSLQDAFYGDVKNETCDDLEFGHEDLEVKFDITVKLEQLTFRTVNMKKEDDNETLNLVKNCAETTCTKTYVDMGRKVSSDINVVSARYLSSSSKKKKSSDEPLDCNKCGHKPEVFNCDRCEFKTYENSNLKKHRRIHTTDEPFMCNLCKFNTKHMYTLVRHKMIHSGDKPFTCEKCSFKSNLMSNLRRHMRTHN